jgi:hypothetical protein
MYSAGLALGHRDLDNGGQFGCGGERESGQDGTSNAPAVTLLSILKEHPNQLPFVDASQVLRTGLAHIAHAHVQGSFTHEGESTVRVVQLGRTDAKVGQDPVDLGDAQLSQSLADLREGTLYGDESSSKAGQARTGRSVRSGVTVHTNDGTASGK